MRCKVALLLLAPALYACGDHAPLDPHSPAGPLWAIADARTDGGIPGFYFLPPILPEPNATGTFDATLTPEVTVCELDGAECTANIVAQFSTTSGLGGQTITVDLTDEQYEVNWHTDLSNLSNGTRYRIQVFVGTLLVGFADVHVAKNGRDLRNAANDDVPLTNGRTLPIKFRLETIIADLVALPAVQDCLVASSCVIQHVEPNHPDGKQVVVTEDEYYAGVFENGFMDSYVAADPATYGNGVTVIIYGRDLPCFAAYAGQQAEACSHRETFPALEAGFDFPQRVEQCLDPAVDVDDYQLHKFSLIGPVAERGQVVPLPRVVGTYVDCADFVATPPTFLAQATRRLLRPFLVLFGPATAYAGDVYYGGMTTSYSDFGYAQPLTMSYFAGDGQTAPTGTSVTTDPTVRVLQGVDDPGHNPPLVPQPAAGVPVTFTVGPEGSDLDGQTSLTVPTDANGEASVSWTLGTQAGGYTLTASIPGQSVQFTATAQAVLGPDLTFGVHNTSLTSPPYFQLWRHDGAQWVRATGTPLEVYSSDDSVSIRAYFINIGDVDSPTTFTNKLWFDTTQSGTLFNSGTNSLLSTGTQGYNEMRRTVTGPTSGCTPDIQAAAQLDNGSQVAETDENNNAASLTYKICAPPIP